MSDVVSGFDSEVRALLSEDFDDEYLRPKDCVVAKLTALVNDALAGEDRKSVV